MASPVHPFAALIAVEDVWLHHGQLAVEAAILQQLLLPRPFRVGVLGNNEILLVGRVVEVLGEALQWVLLTLQSFTLELQSLVALL